LQRRGRFAHEARDIERLERTVVAGIEALELPQHRSGALDGASDVLEVARRVRAGRIEFDQTRAATDGGEDIIEVMRDGPGHLAE
jgi:hypothetical protein